MRPSHHEPSKLEGAVDVITHSALIGGAQGFVAGAVFAVTASRFWPAYRGLTTQFKTYIQISFVLAAGSFRVDRQLLKYERRLQYEAILEQQRQLEAAADRGEFLGIDGRAPLRRPNKASKPE